MQNRVLYNLTINFLY